MSIKVKFGQQVKRQKERGENSQVIFGSLSFFLDPAFETNLIVEEKFK